MPIYMEVSRLHRTVTIVARGTISYVIIRDCVSEAVARIDDLHLAALSEVRVDII